MIFTKRKTTIITLFIMAILLVVSSVFMLSSTAFADSGLYNTEQTEEFLVFDYENDIAATYDFAILNDEECNVKITNKSEATRAVVPSKAIIDGKEYKVTEIAINGFMSSSKLVRVSLPNTIKKIGNSAFANCVKLERINLANVEIIGNSVFNRCLNLKELIIPKSVITVGTSILRSNNTQVRVRAESAGEN